MKQGKQGGFTGFLLNHPERSVGLILLIVFAVSFLIPEGGGGGFFSGTGGFHSDASEGYVSSEIQKDMNHQDAELYIITKSTGSNRTSAGGRRNKCSHFRNHCPHNR